MYENMFVWVCPENGVNLINLLFNPINISKNHRSLVSVSLATWEWQYHKTNHMLPLPRQDFRERTQQSHIQNSICFLFFFQKRSSKKKKKMVYTVLSFRANLLHGSLKTCKANWFLHWFFDLLHSAGISGLFSQMRQINRVCVFIWNRDRKGEFGKHR